MRFCVARDPHTLVSILSTDVNTNTPTAPSTSVRSMTPIDPSLDDESFLSAILARMRLSNDRIEREIGWSEITDDDMTVDQLSSPEAILYPGSVNASLEEAANLRRSFWERSARMRPADKGEGSVWRDARRELLDLVDRTDAAERLQQCVLHIQKRKWSCLEMKIAIRADNISSQSQRSAPYRGVPET